MYHKQGAEESIVLFLCQKKQENDKSQRSFQAPRCSLKSIQPLLLKIKVSSAIMHGDARFDCADLLLSFDLLIRIRKFSDFYKKKKKKNTLSRSSLAETRPGSTEKAGFENRKQS